MNTIHTICIVDDDEEIRSLLSDYLRRNGFSTCTAGNAAEFLEIQRRVPCSLIVMDIMLPGMNGLELFRTLRAESTVPVIFLTALGDITDFTDELDLDARILRDVLPNGLAAKLLSEENPTLANYFQQCFEQSLAQARAMIPAGFESIDDSLPYGGLEYGEFGRW